MTAEPATNGRFPNGEPWPSGAEELAKLRDRYPLRTACFCTGACRNGGVCPSAGQESVTFAEFVEAHAQFLEELGQKRPGYAVIAARLRSAFAREQAPA